MCLYVYIKIITRHEFLNQCIIIVCSYTYYTMVSVIVIVMWILDTINTNRVAFYDSMLSTLFERIYPKSELCNYNLKFKSKYCSAVVCSD